MAFDYKKEYKEFYLPQNTPSIIEIPRINYLAVRGKGDPNKPNGEYKHSIELLYTIAFTIKMSKKSNYKIEGYFDYVVPPLEGFWWQSGTLSEELDYSRKDDFNFISVIRLPDFVTQDDFKWAITEATNKKRKDYSKVQFIEYDEGLCVQCLHVGGYDSEPKTVNLMHEYIENMGYQLDIKNPRYHHEIYLSDPRRCREQNLKTVIRHPIKKGAKMTTSKESQEYLLDQLGIPDDVTTRPMMGEYLLYFRGTLIGGIYDGQLLLKETSGNSQYDLKQVVPYATAKRTMYLIEDFDDKDKLKEIILATYSDLSKK